MKGRKWSKEEEKFLKENYNPYCKVEVSEKGVKIVGDVCLIPIK